MNINGKDKWISTKSSEKEEAKIIASAILNSGIQPAQKQAGSLFHIR